MYGETLGSLRTTFSMFELREEVHRARVTVAAVSLLVFLIGSLVVFGLSSVITAPLRDMLQAVGHIDRGDWSQRVEVRSSDEMGMLAKSFNDMVTSVQNRTKDLEQEISERQRFEAALLESEAAKQAILDAIPDLMFRVDRHGRFLDARGAEEQLLLQPEQIIGHNVTDLLPLRIALRIMTNITDCLASRRAVSFEYGLMLEGRRRYFEARMIPENEFEIFAIVRDTRTPRRRSGPAGMPNGPCRNSGPSVCAQIACARLVRWPPGSPMNSTNRLPGSAGWRNTP
ncbi:MAG: HAMP domain-containing protein [bacterium]|nr:HAMP domain-containing protein [bacterium]